MAGRRIAPRPPLVVSSLTSGDDEGSRDQDTNRPEKPVRKRLSTACQTCQKKKVKCDGNQPCATCVRLDQPCVYAKELDARVGSFKRKFHETQNDQNLLNALIDTMQGAKDEHVAQLVSVIRSQAPLEEIKACIAQQLAEIQASGRERSPEFVQLQDELDELERLQEQSDGWPHLSSRADTLGIDCLIEEPGLGITASPWTTVTGDDHLVSHLVGVFLASDHYWRYWLDKKLFIRDMRSGSLESKFCSPMLVNCILAWACPSSDLEEARMNGGVASPLMTRLIDEAKRLLGEYLSAGEALPLTALQGLSFLYATLTFMGQHALGLRYMMLLLDLMQDPLPSSAATITADEDLAAQEMSESVNRLSWGIFILTTAACACVDRAQSMEPPQRPKPRHGSVHDVFQTSGVSAYTTALARPTGEKIFSLECEIAILQADVTRLRASQAASLPQNLREKRLLDIYDAVLSTVLRHPDYADIVALSDQDVLIFRGRVQCVILQIFLLLQQPVDECSAWVAKFARTRCLEAALEIARIAKLYMDVQGTFKVQSALSGTVFWSLVVLLDEPDLSQHADQITDLCIYTRAMGRYWPMYIGLLQIIKAHAGLKKTRLPPQTDKLFEEFERPAWKLHRLYPLLETDRQSYTAGDGMRAVWKNLCAGAENLSIE